MSNLLVGLFGILGIITFSHGFAYKIPDAFLATYFRAWSWAFVLCLALLARGVALSSRHLDRSAPFPTWLTPTVSALTLLTSVFLAAHAAGGARGSRDCDCLCDPALVAL
jgi:hypothetical protein